MVARFRVKFFEGVMSVRAAPEADSRGCEKHGDDLVEDYGSTEG